MISKNQIKQFHALWQKKNRDSLGLFVAEGPKVVGELLTAFRCTYLAATSQWTQAAADLGKQGLVAENVTEDELRKVSFLQHPQDVFAVFRKPETHLPPPDVVASQLCLALDDIQDPGNLGTIIRLADWFGIAHIFCSLQSADAYGPKVVQATMGALARVEVHYMNLVDYFSQLPAEVPVYGTFLNGRNIYTEQLTQSGIIVMGNEGNGISAEVERCITKRLYIPNYPAGRATSESLNVAVATAVTCSEFRRQAQTD